jgi:hypothetical protein
VQIAKLGGGDSIGKFVVSAFVKVARVHLLFVEWANLGSDRAPETHQTPEAWASKTRSSAGAMVGATKGFTSANVS